MAVDLGRYLKNDEHVDHIDEDKTNDQLSNLQILSLVENNKKHVLAKGKQAKKILLTCPKCTDTFMLTERHYNSRIKNNKKIFCSRTCSSKFYKWNGNLNTSTRESVILEIRKLRAQGGTSYSIASDLGISRNTVMKYWKE